MRMRLTVMIVGLATMGVGWIAPVVAQASARGTGVRAPNVASSEAHDNSWAPATSADGRWVAFSSDANDLLQGNPDNDPNLRTTIPDLNAPGWVTTGSGLRIRDRIVEKVIPEHMSGWDFRKLPGAGGASTA